MINEDATFRWKGYRSTDLSANSGKKVWVICEGCGKGRWREYRARNGTRSNHSNRDMCRSCALSRRVFSEEHKKKIGDVQRGEKGNNYGKKASEETRKKLSDARRGDKNHFFGKTHTDKTKKKISDANAGHICTEENKCKISKALKGKYTGENHSQWKGGKITIQCKQCGVKKEVFPSRGNEEFCSNECKFKYQQGQNHPHWKGGKIKKLCEQCGKEYNIARYKKDASRFCSHECRAQWQKEGGVIGTFGLSGEKSNRWMGGISFEPYCEKFNETFKESIREKFNRICFLCPTTEIENGRKLSVHHVAYQKGCMCDDDLTNCEFVPLCDKCHARTNGNRDYWKNLILTKLAETSIL